MLPLLITDVYVNALFIKWSGWLIYFGKLRIFLLEKCQINCIYGVTAVLVSFKFILSVLITIFYISSIFQWYSCALSSVNVFIFETIIGNCYVGKDSPVQASVFSFTSSFLVSIHTLHLPLHWRHNQCWYPRGSSLQDLSHRRHNPNHQWRIDHPLGQMSFLYTIS